MPTNLTDRLGELVDKVTPGPVFAAAMNYIQHSAIDPKISGDDAFNRESKANAEFIALCFTHKDEILSALRKAEEPVSGDYAELVGRLRATKPHIKRGGGVIASHDFPINPDGPEAATAIERLTAREAELRTVVALATGLVPGGYGNWHTRARLSLGDEK